MRYQLFAMSFAAFLSVPALAQTTPEATPAPAATEDSHLNEMVCKKQPPPTGSRIAGKTVCMTNREWLAAWSASQDATKAMQNKSMTQMPGGG